MFWTTFFRGGVGTLVAVLAATALIVLIVLLFR
jgi:hypothetical protein